MQIPPPVSVMEYSAIHDTWSYMDDSHTTVFSDYYSERLVGSLVDEASSATTLDCPSIVYEDPTYINIHLEVGRPSIFHFGDRYKGLFMFLRETNTKKKVISSLQDDIETLLNLKSNCKLSSENEATFATDIIIFATMIDNHLRRVQRHSTAEFDVLVKKLTKLEMKWRLNTASTLSFSPLRNLFRFISASIFGKLSR
ncbi:unnamed protein product [Cylicocyclus nassatus]|uniref:Uncharacterized protein n=1 Tax=Cylicocyclus nassatus TaxID=53992 RepID=A0AA36M5G7_CYLNA|nr:unnamed protein product [Cylicocyclus nassatus]